MKRSRCFLCVLLVVGPLGALVAPAASGAAVGWYVDCSSAAIALFKAQCADTKQAGVTAPVRKTLEEATAWLTDSHGYRSPSADTIKLKDAKEYFVAVVYVYAEDFCGGRFGCFNSQDRRLYVADPYIQEEKAIVHELFHAIQLAYGAELFEVLGTQAQSQTANNMIQLRGWIAEGTAEAVGFAWASRGTPQAVAPPIRRYDVPLHKPASTEDTYNTAAFWQFVGLELQSPDGIQYLEELLREEGLSIDNGLLGVDAFLKPYGGLSKLLPRFLARQPFGEAFGDVAQWRATLPAGETERSKTFTGHVRAVAGKAGRLEVTHSSERPVDVEIRFRGDDSDLHLIVDGEVRTLGADLGRNVYTTRLGGGSEAFEIVVAEVAANAESSAARQFDLEVLLKERANSSFTFDVSGAATGSQNGWIWVSRQTESPFPLDSELCHASIHFVPAARGTGGVRGMTPLPSLSLTIGAIGGLRTHDYTVGVDETLGAGQALMRNAHPDTFFAHLSANLTNPIPNLPAGYPSAGSFSSTGGRVSIDYIDAERIEGSFDVQFQALVPAEGLFNENNRAVDATVTGDFAGTFAPLSERLLGINGPSEDVYDCAPPGE